MIATIDMLLEGIEGAEKLQRPENIAPRFSRIALAASPENCPLDEETLLIGTLDECQLVTSKVSASPPWSLALDASNPAEHTFAFATVHDAAYVYMYALTKLARIAAWQLHLKRIVIAGGSYQDMLDISEGMLGNHVHVTDQNLQVIAQTYGIAPDPAEKYTVEAMKNGHFSSEAINAFRSADRPRKWLSQHAIILQQSAREGSSNPYYDYYFHSQGFVMLHLIMHTDRVAPSPALRGRLQVLVDHIKDKMESDIASGRGVNVGAARALSDLAGNLPVDEQTVRDEVISAGMNPDEPMRVLAFDFGFDADKTELGSYGALRLSSRFEGTLAATLSNRVLLLMPDLAFNRPEIQADLEEYAGLHSCKVGVSDRITSLMHVCYAWQEALASLLLNRTSKYVMTFNEIFPLWISSPEGHSRELEAFCMEHSVPARILAGEGQKGVETLKVFLQCERRATAAAEQLFIHRTTLLYQIERMEERYGFSLNNPAARDRLAIEFKIMD